jgi:hypothetical protein
MLQEIERRLELIRAARINTILQSVEIELCKRDILYWFKNYAWTDKNTSLFSSDDP